MITSSTPTTRDELIRATARRAVEHYKQAKDFACIAQRLDVGGHNQWAALAVDWSLDAERALIAAILAHDESFRDWDISSCQCRHWKGRGVLVDGSLYMAVPNPDSDLKQDDTPYWLMRLVVVEAGAIVSIEAATTEDR